jgi:hypothetical protein
VSAAVEERSLFVLFFLEKQRSEAKRGSSEAARVDTQYQHSSSQKNNVAKPLCFSQVFPRKTMVYNVCCAATHIKQRVL